MCLETFMGVEQRTGPGTNPCISRVVSKSDSDLWTATTATNFCKKRHRYGRHEYFDTGIVEWLHRH